MPINVGQLIVRNWPIKLAALFFAVMLYVGVAAQQPLTQTFELRLAVVPPPGRSLKQAPPPISVAVSGKGSEILKLRSFPRTISRTVPETLVASVWKLHRQPGGVALPKGADIQVTDITPRAVDALLGSAIRKDARVAPRVRLEKDSGFALTGLAVLPGTAHLVGPVKSLAGIDSVATLPVEIPSVPGPVYRTVALDTSALGVVRIVPREVRLVAEVSALSQRVFARRGVGPELASLVILSQDVHKVFGGVVPELASRAHLAALPAVVAAALDEAGVSWGAVDAVAVTAGPGLVGALLVGVVYAKALAYAGDRALIGVHHMEGHVFAPAVEDPELAPPFVALLVSGGHTLLLDVPAWGRYRLLGQTRDDAAGEAFDKVATLLELGYPGGPPIERLAVHGDPARFSFPRPLLEDGFEFSFSGLKTALLRAVRASTDLERDRPQLARAFQDAVLDVLVTKLERAVRLTGHHTAVLGGGVACSRALATLASRGLGAPARGGAGTPRLTANTAAMIAGAGWGRLERGERSDWPLDARADPPPPGLDPPPATPHSAFRTPHS